MPIGFAQMFHALNNHPQITVEVFTDRATALAWLADGPESVTASTAR